MVLSEDEAEIKKAMIAAAKQVICLVDYSKFHQSALASFASLKDLQVLITDDRISEEDRSHLKHLGIKLEIA